MSPLRKYQIELADIQVERLTDASSAIHVIANLRSNSDNALTRPEWWSDYYDGALTAVEKIASNVVGSICDDIREQCADQDQGEPSR